jgi:3-keto-disaccharide hydrolase
MKTFLILRWITIITGFLLLAGCGSEPAKSPTRAAHAGSTQTNPGPPKGGTPNTPTTRAGQSQAGPLAVARPEFKEVLQQAAAKPSSSFEGEGWQPMFDGKTLAGWRETDFAGHGQIQCESGLMVLNMGDPFTGINWTNDFPKMNYEVALDAMRVMGSDFFCGLTVPVGDTFCSLIVGGWGGSLVGISSLDSLDASENETTKFSNFEKDRWYRIRLRVTEARIEAWIDKEKLVDVETTGKRISVRPGDIEMSKPIGVAAWQTTAALREVKMRRVNSVSGRQN